MTAQWALEPADTVARTPLCVVAQDVIQRFADGAVDPHEVAAVRAFQDTLVHHAPIHRVDTMLHTLSHAGYLRGAVVVMASVLAQDPRNDIALVLAGELLDALAPDLGVALCHAVLADPQTTAKRMDTPSWFCLAHRLLGTTMLERGEPQTALRHFEAVLSIDVRESRALRGWTDASDRLHIGEGSREHRQLALSSLDGLDDLKVFGGAVGQRYEIGAPLGRGRYAVVYRARDMRVGRDVALKRLLDAQGQPGTTSPRLLQTRFFAEARALGRVRSPFVVGLLDVQPESRFIAMDLCHGGNLRRGLRHGLVSPIDLPRIGLQLRAALEAVHAAGAVHRDVKPANILIREPKRGSPIALADFGLAVGPASTGMPGRAGTLRYLAPEVRRERRRPLPASDRWSAGAVLLELALMPSPLPAIFDRIDGNFDAAAEVPDDLPQPWSHHLRSLLSRDPEARTW